MPHIITSQRSTGLRPPQPPLPTTPRTHVGSHSSEEAAPQQPLLDPTLSRDTQGRQHILPFCCGPCGWATQAKILSPATSYDLSSCPPPLFPF